MKFDIIGKRYFWFALSILIMVPGLLSIAVQALIWELILLAVRCWT